MTFGRDDADAHLLARRQVAHLHGEDVVAVLLQEGGAFAVLDRLLVGRPGFAALLHDPLDEPGADPELERADRRTARHGEDVGGLEGLRERVVKLLFLDDVGHVIGDSGRDLHAR